ncbi:MAG: hypothetical protein FMNOHCHN_02269 [Ignavibacteriaceae bacterium]|nr:hypothetical protein [Ignavibacteriaceae bacterium]
MTCSDDDEDCPVVLRAERRFPIRYEDLKKYDGTLQEEKKQRALRTNRDGDALCYLDGAKIKSEGKMI